jgi:hypothetical protein
VQNLNFNEPHWREIDMHLISPKKWLPIILVCTVISPSQSFAVQINESECATLREFVMNLLLITQDTARGQRSYYEAKALLLLDIGPDATQTLDAIEMLELARGETVDVNALTEDLAGLFILTDKCPPP